jgi:hypothetical protein
MEENAARQEYSRGSLSSPTRWLREHGVQRNQEIRIFRPQLVYLQMNGDVSRRVVSMKFRGPKGPCDRGENHRRFPSARLARTLEKAA